jgi:lipid A 3-O-deacylase
MSAGQTLGCASASAVALATAAALALVPASAPRADTPAARWRPDVLFVQAGAASDTHAVVFGATWPWAWQRQFRGGTVAGYWEASFGRWSTTRDDVRSSAWVTQAGVTPVVRWRPQSWGGDWYVEGGIGANVLLPIYRSHDKRFSTAFNFGDHVAIGRRFGAAHEHELSLRVQHFSNAGIKKPNPGEDFLQLRYSHRF